MTTPRGGQHFYFRYPDRAEIRNSAGKLGAGLDVRGEGGYVVCAPTPGYEPDEQAPVAEAPAWLVELMSADRRGPAPPVSEEIPEGERNGALTSLGGSMRRRGMSREAIAAALRTENAARCKPPLPEREVEAIAASVARYEPAVETPDEPLPDELRAPEEEAERSTWAPVDLGPVLASDEPLEPPPTILARTDGERLIYAAKSHLIFGEPEVGKGWLAAAAAAEQLAAGEHVLYIDFDDQDPRVAVARLRALGVGDGTIAERFHYAIPTNHSTPPAGARSSG